MKINYILRNLALYLICFIPSLNATRVIYENVDVPVVMRKDTLKNGLKSLKSGGSLVSSTFFQPYTDQTMLKLLLKKENSIVNTKQKVTLGADKTDLILKNTDTTYDMNLYPVDIEDALYFGETEDDKKTIEVWKRIQQSFFEWCDIKNQVKSEKEILDFCKVGSDMWPRRLDQEKEGKILCMILQKN